MPPGSKCGVSVKIKLPKKVMIKAGEYQIIQNKEIADSSFSLNDKTITIGTKHKQPLEILEGFFHEVYECITAVSLCRYLDNAYSEYLFVMTHKEFTQAMADFTQAIKDVVITK